MDIREFSRRQTRKLDPLGRFLNKVGLSPNVITAVSLVFAFVSGYFLYQSNIILGIIFLALNLAFDALDGVIARAASKVTAVGMLFDKVIDRYSWIILFTALMLSGRANPFWISIAIFATMIRNYIDQKAQAQGIRYKGIFSTTIGIRPLILLGLVFSAVNEIIIAIAVLNNIAALAQLGLYFRLMRRSEETRVNEYS